MIGSRVVIAPPSKFHPSGPFWKKHQQLYQEFVGTTQLVVSHGHKFVGKHPIAGSELILTYWYHLEPATNLIRQNPIYLGIKNQFVSYFNNSWLQPVCQCTIDNLLLNGCKCGGF